MSIERRYTASFHGHSPYSDGLSPVPALVKKAADLGINFFGISDHNTANGVRELYDAITRTEDNLGISITPVSAVEITTNQGDLLIAKPGNYNPEFIKWANGWSEERHQHDLLETINVAVKSFEAIAVVVHPGEPLLSGVPVDLLKELPEKLDQKTLLNVGLEVQNWSTRLLPRRARLRELMIGRLATSLNLARFGFSDFHHAWQIPKQLTYADLKSPTPEDFMVAVQQRKVFPNQGESISPINWMRLIFTFITTHFQHPNLNGYK